MDVREKLVELLDEAEEWANHECDELDCGTCQAGKMRGNCFQQLMVGRLIANGVTVQEWVSVKDRLPEESGYYLVFADNGRREVLSYSKKYQAFNAFDDAYSEEYVIPVTHWMPMPNPPKGE